MTAQRVTTDEAAGLIGVKAATIRSWKHRGLVVPVGLLPGRGKPVPLYDLDDLAILALRRREHDQTERGSTA